MEPLTFVVIVVCKTIQIVLYNALVMMVIILAVSKK